METTQPFPNESSVVINEVALEPIRAPPVAGSWPPKMHEDGIDKHETHQKNSHMFIFGPNYAEIIYISQDWSLMTNAFCR